MVGMEASLTKQGGMLVMTELVEGWLVAVNLVAFAVYGIDKYKSMHGKWRTRERTLLFLAFLGGSVGAWLGMQMFRHKTQHMKFRFGVPALFLVQLLLAAWLLLGGHHEKMSNHGYAQGKLSQLDRKV